MEHEINKWIDAVSAVKRALYRSVLVKRELSQKAKLSIYPSTYVPTLIYEALQCHFTWDLEPTKSQLKYLRYALEDIGTDEGNVWLGQISNLKGFIHFKLGSSDKALSIFRRASETFQRLKNSDDDPWFMVNFGNLAWLNHLMGEDKKSHDYLSKVEALMREYSAPPEEELHPEVYAETAWTLMKFDKEKKLQAAELFQRAVMMQPGIADQLGQIICRDNIECLRTFTG
ncbi:PREDICTED: interferon-induced protein with tetratricopeptide repeats 1-like [Cyprinodon variegatus]|uniref:interferon-induced protein with tetratricopeptide repeats 1-like n=1 Tax=Cyprinodon variegatus TaxID=28743 RepID=UPI000742C368|nr:PREDICTED: interferon-induced protein with tetratricopeptide repeats 1-like [Cyprinodon variegatus]